MLCTPCNSSACTCTVRRVARQHNHVVAGELSAYRERLPHHQCAAVAAVIRGWLLRGARAPPTQRCQRRFRPDPALLDRHVRERARTPLLEPHIHVILIGY